MIEITAVDILAELKLPEIKGKIYKHCSIDWLTPDTDEECAWVLKDLRENLGETATAQKWVGYYQPAAIKINRSSVWGEINRFIVWGVIEA